MELQIKKTDLLDTPCDRYNDLPEKFDAIEEITNPISPAILTN